MAKGKSLWKYTQQQQRCFSSTGRKELYWTCPQDRGGPPSRQDLTPTALRCVKHSVQSVFLLCSKSSEGSVSLTARHKVPVLTHRPCVTTSFLRGLLILFFFFFYIYYEKSLNILKNSIMNLIYPLPIRCSHCDHLADLAGLQSFSCIVYVLLETDGTQSLAPAGPARPALFFTLPSSTSYRFPFPLTVLSPH